jgi:hypothetical protein
MQQPHCLLAYGASWKVQLHQRKQQHAGCQLLQHLNSCAMHAIHAIYMPYDERSLASCAPAVCKTSNVDSRAAQPKLLCVLTHSHVLWLLPPLLVGRVCRSCC